MSDTISSPAGFFWNDSFGATTATDLQSTLTSVETAVDTAEASAVSASTAASTAASAASTAASAASSAVASVNSAATTAIANINAAATSAEATVSTAASAASTQASAAAGSASAALSDANNAAGYAGLASTSSSTAATAQAAASASASTAASSATASATGATAAAASASAAASSAALASESETSTAALVAAIGTGLLFKGTWNASTNTPAIPTAVTGNQGWFYTVTVAGTTSISGIASWAVGDQIASTGSVWVKNDNAAVLNYNGRSGAVVSELTDIPTAGATSGQVLAFNGTQPNWVAPSTVSVPIDISTLGTVAALTGPELFPVEQSGTTGQANLETLMAYVNTTLAQQLSDLLGLAPKRSAYTGVVATRCWANPDTFNSGSAYTQMERIYHWARDDITTLQVGWAHWSATGNTGEVLPTNNLTIKGSIEYPAGVFHQLKWGGATSTSLTPGATIFTDPLSVVIPRGAKFYTLRYANGSSYCFQNPANDLATLMDVANGDAVSYTQGDLTMSGGVVDGAVNAMPCVAAIIGPTTRPSIGLIGDSRVHGHRDTVSANLGDAGQFARSIGKEWGYLNLAISNDTTTNFVTGGGTNSSRRRALLQYCTHILSDFGIADIFDLTLSGAQVISALQTLYGMPGIAGKPIFQSTLMPTSTSTDSWATTGNQTTTNNSQRGTVNTWIASVPSPLVGVFDVCPPVETSPGSGIWKAPSITVDGVHPTPLGYNNIVEYGSVDINQIA